MRSISKNAEGFIRLFIGFPALLFWPSKVTPRKVAEESDLEDWPPVGRWITIITTDGEQTRYMLKCYDYEKLVLMPVPPWGFLKTNPAYKDRVKRGLEAKGFRLFFEPK
jgi:hypothetical protein